MIEVCNNNINENLQNSPKIIHNQNKSKINSRKNSEENKEFFIWDDDDINQDLKEMDNDMLGKFLYIKTLW